MAYFELTKSIRITKNGPIDGDRYIATDQLTRESLITSERAHVGLQVYQEDNSTLYILKTLGTTPATSTWDVVGTGQGSTLWSVTGDDASNTNSGDINITNNLNVTGNIITDNNGDSTEWDTAYKNSISTNPTFSPSTGVLTFTQQDTSTLTVDLDGRYLTSYTETDPIFGAHTVSDIVDGTGFLKNDGNGNWSYDNSTYDNYNSWTLKSNSESTGISMGSGSELDIVGGTNVTVSRATRTITISAESGSNVNFGSSNTIPYMNSVGDNFLYSNNLTFNGSTLNINNTITTQDLNLSGTLSCRVGTGTGNRNKIRVNNDDYYTIGMKHNVGIGGISIAMTHQVLNNTYNNLGFWWGDTNHSDGYGAMALTSHGKLTVARSIRVGYGEDDNISTSYILDVGGSSRFTGSVTASDFVLSSDKRLKENIIDLKYSDIKTFNFKSDKDKKLRYGVIAQDLEKTNPELVNTNDKGYKSVSYIDYLLMKMAEKDEQIKKLENILLKKN